MNSLFLRLAVHGVLCVFSAQFSQSALAQRTAELPTELQQQVDAIIKKSQVRGGAVVLVDATGPVGAAWFGTANVQSGVAVSSATCMRAGGLVNTFTSVLAMRLAEQNKLDLDAVLPTDLQPTAPAACQSKVSVAQLLEQTAGLTDAARAGTTKRVLSWCPGLHYRASEDSVVLAAEAISRAGGSDFADLMQREVFAPLGLRQTGFVPAESGSFTPSCLSRSYGADGIELGADRRQHLPLTASLVSTPLELASLLQMLLRYGDGPLGNVLEPCSVAHLASGSTGLASRLGVSATTEGRGLKRLVAAGRLMVGYAARFDGFHTVIGMAPEVGRGMVIVLNTDDPAALARLHDLLATWVWQGAGEVRVPRDAASAQGISGWYVKPTQSDTPQAWWRAARDLVRVTATANGAELRSVWPWGVVRHVAAVTPQSFRSPALPLAGMAFAVLPDGSRWWIEGESHAEISPLLALGTLATPLVVVLLFVVGLVCLFRRALRRPRSALFFSVTSVNLKRSSCS